MNEKQFRFQDFDVWKHAAAFSCDLFRIADQLESKHLFRFAEQLRAATLSITNNIAEGSGSMSRVDFANFLNMARRSTFEVANILFLLGNQPALKAFNLAKTLSDLGQESRMLIGFIRTLTAPRSK